MSETSNDEVKVFISWSGEPSREVAKSLRTGIKSVFDKVVPFVSDVDIEAGSRGLQVIEAALQGSGFGVIIVTPDNMKAPWLNFEAGALSKALGDDETRVVPLLIGFSAVSQLTGPLSQFQARLATVTAIRGLFHELGEQVGVEREIINGRMETWVPSFITIVESAVTAGSDAPPRRSSEDLLDELLDLVRGLRRDINTPEPRSATTRRNSDTVGNTIDLKRIKLLLEISGIEDASLMRMGDKTWIVDVKDEPAENALAMSREIATESEFELIFRMPSGEIL